MAVSSYLFTQTVGNVDYPNDYFLGKERNLEALLSTYKVEIHYWVVDDSHSDITFFSHDNQVLSTGQQNTIHAGLDDIANVTPLPVATHYHSQSPDNVLEITTAVDASYEVTKQYRYVYLTATAGAIATLNLNISAGLSVGESFEVVMTLAFADGAGLSLDGLSGDVFDGSGNVNMGINVNGTYSVIVHKLASGVNISTALTDAVAHTQVITPEKYIEFDGVDSHFEVATGDLTGNLSNVLDLGQSWTITGILRKEHLSASTVMFNRWSNFVGIGKHNGTNVFMHGINGNGGGYYFTSEQTSNLTNKRFFFINDGATLSCYIENNLAFTTTHNSVNSTAVNGQLIVGLRKHYGTIMSQSAGGLDDVLIFNAAINSTQMLEVMASVDHTSLSNYAAVGAWWKMGEDVFPNIYDSKRAVNNTYLNGLASDYKEV